MQYNKIAILAHNFVILDWALEWTHFLVLLLSFEIQLQLIRCFTHVSPPDVLNCNMIDCTFFKAGNLLPVVAVLYCYG